MLVDDEEVLVRLGEEMIAKLGYEPIGYTSPSEALQAFEADPERFDIVLTDETMPGMTGSQLAERIRAISTDVPIVLMSGYAAAPLAARALVISHAASRRRCASVWCGETAKCIPPRDSALAHR